MLVFSLLILVFVQHWRLIRLEFYFSLRVITTEQIYVGSGLDFDCFALTQKSLNQLKKMFSIKKKLFMKDDTSLEALDMHPYSSQTVNFF